LTGFSKPSGEISELDSSIKTTEGKSEQTIIPPVFRHNLLGFGSITLFTGVITLLYGNIPVNQLVETMEKFVGLSLLGLIISTLISLYSLIRCIPFWYKKKSYDDRMKTLEQMVSGKHDIMTAVKSNKSKLNIDRIAEHLNYLDYEKYLRKTYG